MLRMQRTLCNLLRPSLELLSVSTLVDTGHGEMTKKNLIRKPGVSVISLKSAGHRMDALDTASATRASSQLKQLTSMCYVGVNVICWKVKLEGVNWV